MLIDWKGSQARRDFGERQASEQNVNPAFAKFKSAMIPKIGQKITVVGTLQTGNKASGSRSMTAVSISIRPMNQALQKQTVSTLAFAAARLQKSLAR
jgi:hypothetical protein